jgi:elongation factor P hydroxylase
MGYPDELAWDILNVDPNDLKFNYEIQPDGRGGWTITTVERPVVEQQRQALAWLLPKEASR